MSVDCEYDCAHDYGYDYGYENGFDYNYETETETENCGTEIETETENCGTEIDETHPKTIFHQMVGKHIDLYRSHISPDSIVYVSGTWRPKWFGPKYKMLVIINRKKMKTVSGMENIVPVATWNLLRYLDQDVKVNIATNPLFGNPSVETVSWNK